MNWTTLNTTTILCVAENTNNWKRDRETKMGSDGYLPLFETKRAKGRVLYRLFVISMFVAICLIWIHRVSYIPIKGEDGRWAWIGLLVAELWFGFYWVLTQAQRWNQVYRSTFKDRLSKRFLSHSPSLQWIGMHICT